MKASLPLVLALATSSLFACTPDEKGSAASASGAPKASASAAGSAAAAKSTASAAASTEAAASADAPAAAPAGAEIAGFFEGDPALDVKGWKGWINREYDYGFLIPTGWTSASLPGGGFMMHDKDQKAIIALDYGSGSELTLASLEKKAKMAPFMASELTEVVPMTFVDVGKKKFLAKAALAKGQLNKGPGELFWMDLAGIQTHDGETSDYHFIVMIGFKEGVSDEAKGEAMSAIRAMTPMSGRPYWKR